MLFLLTTLLYALSFALYYYRYQRALLEGGHVFIACPPLYKVLLIHV
jgi:DNA gyrase/topoisomerase IV subunit B